ncbi:MAG: AAA family ATPase [Chitinophagaceae bacterium]|jgi:hypothetical protein|nr:AAA family ATPase [Chitinophagaceae bacterium]
MIQAFRIENFKSIKLADIPLSTFSITTGANNAGKSSLIYAILVLKYFAANPNRSIDNVLTLPFINLGGFEQTVFLKNVESSINLELIFEEDDYEVGYGISLGISNSKLFLKGYKPYEFLLEMEIGLPYPANKTVNFDLEIDDFTFSFGWNGFLANTSWAINKTGTNNYNLEGIDKESSDKVWIHLIKMLKLPIKGFEKIDFVPTKRGFYKPFYGLVPLSNSISTEDELATLLANEPFLVKKVDYYFQKITGHKFEIYSPPGITTFYLRVENLITNFSSELVNEGTGINQLVSILSKVLYNKSSFICIDEPEIHLHPSFIDKLVDALVEISEAEAKQFLISTHSEHFINALLKNLSNGKINVNDLNFYYLEKGGNETTIELQKANKDGQIEGGLFHFYATELENLKDFFKL